MAVEWHYAQAGRRHGPVTLAELEKLAEAGELTPGDFVWREGLPKWVKASSIKGLFPSEDHGSSPPPLPDEGEEENPAAPPHGSSELEPTAKAAHNHLQATSKLSECQAHLKVYGKRLASAAEDGLEFIEAALEVNPKSSAYWNTKGLLLTDGLAEHEKALACLKRALELEPDSIVIKQNIRNVKQLDQREQQSQGCLGMLAVLAASGLGICAALVIALVT